MKPKVVAFFSIFSSLVLFAPTIVNAATEVGGFFSSDQHWTATGSPYVVLSGNAASGVGMTSGATLTIDPGVVVKFEAGAQLLTGTGKIKAIGSAEEPIVFTALNDDTAGGDTNEDGVSTSTPAFWSRIQPANDDDEFQYAQIRYADYCLWVSFASPSIRNSTMESCNYGLEVQHTTSTIEIIDNVIRDNKTGLRFLVTAEGIKFSNNNIYDNSDLGAENLTPSKEIDASGNWWGDETGPFHASQNPSGLGNGISDGFILSDFLSAAVATSTATTTATTTPETSGAGGNPNGQFGGTSPGQRPPPQTIRPQILSFKASPESYKEGGEPIVLSWETGVGEFAKIEPGIGDVPLSGTLEINPNEPTRYTLTLIGPGGIVSEEVFVDVASRDPVIIVPGILGSFNGRLDPILNTYEGLINGLKSVGYAEGQTLFRFPYDWWNDNRFTARLLGNRINEVLEICSCQKVDIVAHSMGGLVARYYLQNIDDQHVDQLIFIGTPHLGAPKAYLAWEAGEMGAELSDELGETVFALLAYKNGYGSDVPRYIRERVQSVEQLLPIYKYLTNFESGEVYEYEKCQLGLFVCNKFLEELNNGAVGDSKFYNLFHDNLPTFRSFIVSKNLESRLLEKNLWIHGRPIRYPNFDGILLASGDGTVPRLSALGVEAPSFNLPAAHRYLPYFSQSEVSRILINQNISQPNVPLPYGKILFFRLGSPADIIVTGPDGNTFGSGAYDQGRGFYSGPEDPEFISIPEPQEGRYKISVVGTGNGTFEVETSLLGDDLNISKSFQGEISAGRKYEFDFDYSAANNELSDLEERDTTPPETELLVNGRSISFRAIDESRIDKTLYSLDSGDSWAEFENDLIFDEGFYEVLYLSVDEFGNEEYVKIANFSVEQNELVVAENQESDTIPNNSVVSDSETNNATTGEVLGLTNDSEENKDRGGSLVPYGLLIIIALALTYLIFRKQKL